MLHNHSMVGFDEQRLLGAAAAHLGVEAPLESMFRPPFSALVAGLREEAGLSQVGSWRAGARLMEALGQRVALRAFEDDTPALAEVEIRAPIFITGMPRAGTYLVHNLLARTPGLCAPRLWELQRPIPPRRIDERWIDRQIRSTRTAVEQVYAASPELRRLHPMAPTSPEACSWLLRASFSTLDYALRWHLPSYVEQLLDAEPRAAYRDHRRLLRVLAYRHRYELRAGARLVLADPWHLCHLDALLDAYPDASLIRVQTDRAQAIESLARTCWALQRVDAKRPRAPAELRAYCATLVDAAREGGARGVARLPAWRLIDVPYTKLCEDPLAMLEQLGGAIQLPSGAAALDDASRWLSDCGQLPRRAPAAQPRANY